jgi:hypothetical protein
MKNIILGVVTFFSAMGAVHARECPAIQAQTKYYLNERFFTIGTDLDILSGERKIGQVVQRLINGRKTFELLDEKEQVVAKAVKDLNPVVTTVNIYDCEDRLIGVFKENFENSIRTMKIQTIYSLMDASGQLVAQSEKLDILGTDIVFYNDSKEGIAILSRPLLRRPIDKWVLNLNGDSQIDSSVFFFAAAYKTSADRKRR